MRRSFVAIVIVAALAASMVAFSAGPAFAGGCTGNATNAPDARGRLDGGAWQGGGSYPQIVLARTVPVGEAALVEARWKNVSSATATIRVRGFAFAKMPGMRVKVFMNGENVTARFRDANPGLTFRNLAPNARTGIVEVRFKNAADSGFPFGQQGLFGYYKGSSQELCDAVLAAVND